MLARMHIRNRNLPSGSKRYSELEKDICAYEFLTGGKAHFEYFSKNMNTMNMKTITRHVSKNTSNIQEGEVDIKGLKSYLVDNALPMAVVLCEDGTRVTAAVEYDHEHDSLSGLVAPLDINGLPQRNTFTATTPYKIVNDIETFAVGSFAYVQLAVPLSRVHAPYLLFYSCSDNRFNTEDVLNRWSYTETELLKEGIRVIANASDGDSRLLKAMKIRSGFEDGRTFSDWGVWYRVTDKAGVPLNVQGMTHTLNKFRNRFVRGDLQIGKLFLLQYLNISNPYYGF